MEPVSAGIGIVVFGLKALKGITDYYQSFSAANDTIKHVLASATSLTDSLALLEKHLQSPALSKDVVSKTERDVDACRKHFEKLDKVLRKIHNADKEHGGLRSKALALTKRSVYPFKESTLLKIKEECADVQSNLSLTLHVLQIDIGLKSNTDLERIGVQQRTVIGQVSSIQDDVSAARKSIQTLQLAHEDKQHLKLLEWLSPMMGRSESRLQEVYNIQERQDGAANSLMRTPEFTSWFKRENQALLCISGQGMGKTVAASILIRTLQGIAESASEGAAYVFYTYKERKLQTPANVIAALCQQLLGQNRESIGSALRLQEQHSAAHTRPSLDDHIQLLSEIVATFAKVTIVLDAFDESPEENGSREHLLAKLQSMKTVPSLLIFSRPAIALNQELADALRLNFQSQDADIEQYLTQRFSRYRRMQDHFKKDAHLYKLIIDSIVAKARSVFLLAKLYADTIIPKRSRRDIKEALQSLPNGLTDAYEDAMVRMMAASDSDIALKALFWVFRCRRLLTTDELKHALAVRVGDSELDRDGILEIEDILSACAGMVVINKDTNLVSFLHFTVEEYFWGEGAKYFQHCLYLIAQTCLTYLLFDSVTKMTEDDVDLAEDSDDGGFPLLGYCMEHWGDHARNSVELSLNETADMDTMAMIKQYFGQPRATYRARLPHDKYWLVDELRYRNGVIPRGRNAKPLHVAVSLGLAKVALELLNSKNAPVDAIIKNHALLFAVANGRVDSLAVLLEYGAPLHVRGDNGFTALHVAACLDNVQVIQMLLEYGADPECRDWRGTTPLMMAALGGSTNAAKMLLKAHANINAISDSGITATHHATIAKKDEFLNFLMEHDADFSIVDKYGRTPLSIAESRNRTSLAESLRAYEESRRRRQQVVE